jgi:histidine decarboxylase
MLDRESILTNLRNSISPYEQYCEGYGNEIIGNSYLLGINLGVGKDRVKLSHRGSNTLDEINAFDLAEIDNTYLGQINMTVVSSFCGPQGVIWGYDVARPHDLFDTKNFFKKIEFEGESVSSYNIDPLLRALTKLFGTKAKRKFILRPGSHVPCASKNIKNLGPCTIYAGIALGIPENRKEEACLLMEDTGQFPSSVNPEAFLNVVKENLAKSIIQIGKNQGIRYKQVFVGGKFIEINEGEIGCALVAAPYFKLAKRAIPVTGLESLVNCSLEEWEDNVFG